MNTTVAMMYGEELAQRLCPEPQDPNNNGEGLLMGKSARGDKYSLRPRSMRARAVEQKAAVSPATPKPRGAKPKQKPAPLSKYRRKTANARERSRMREINQAFETLRRAVPHVTATPAAAANEKLTKITTLKLAMKYISTLSAALTSGSDCGSVADLLSDCSDLDCLLSDGESLALHSDLSDHSLTPADFSGVDFVDHSLTPVDFSPLSSEFGDSHLSPFDPFLTDFS